MSLNGTSHVVVNTEVEMVKRQKHEFDMRQVLENLKQIEETATIYDFKKVVEAVLFLLRKGEL